MCSTPQALQITQNSNLTEEQKIQPALGLPSEILALEYVDQIPEKLLRALNARRATRAKESSEPFRIRTGPWTAEMAPHIELHKFDTRNNLSKYRGEDSLRDKLKFAAFEY